MYKNLYYTKAHLPNQISVAWQLEYNMLGCIWIACHKISQISLVKVTCCCKPGSEKYPQPLHLFIEHVHHDQSIIHRARPSWPVYYSSSTSIMTSLLFIEHVHHDQSIIHRAHPSWPVYYSSSTSIMTSLLFIEHVHHDQSIIHRARPSWPVYYSSSTSIMTSLLFIEHVHHDQSIIHRARPTWRVPPSPRTAPARTTCRTRSAWDSSRPGQTRRPTPGSVGVSVDYHNIALSWQHLSGPCSGPRWTDRSSWRRSLRGNRSKPSTAGGGHPCQA